MPIPVPSRASFNRDISAAENASTAERQADHPGAVAPHRRLGRKKHSAIAAWLHVCKR
jgi:hypothetical protein